MEDYSIKVAEQNKIGQKGKDNGVLLLVSKNDRKIRIEVGYGPEGKLTDRLTGRIIDYVISPNFKSGDMDRGFTAGIDAIIGAAKGEFKADSIKKPKEISSFPFVLIFILFFIFVSLTSGFKLPVRGLLGGVFGIRYGPCFIFYIRIFQFNLIDTFFNIRRTDFICFDHSFFDVKRIYIRERQPRRIFQQRRRIRQRRIFRRRVQRRRRKLWRRRFIRRLVMSKYNPKKILMLLKKIILKKQLKIRRKKHPAK